MEDIRSRIDNITLIDEGRYEAGAIQPAPKSVKIEITSRCNLRCKFCALRTRQVGGNEDMDFDFFRRITEDMRLSGVQEIGLFYLGESFMAPELLIECCEWVKKQLEFPWVFLTSNGVKAKPEYVNQLMDAGLDSLKWSVNYFDPHDFCKMTGGSLRQLSSSIENIEEAFKIRNEHKYNTIISASSILYEDDTKDKMERWLTTKIIPYIDDHYWLPLYQMSMYKKEIQDALGFTPTAGNMGRIDEDTMTPNRSPLPCWSAFTEGHVRVDGNLSACCFGADDRFDMGLLDGRNFMRAWNSPMFQAIRQAQLNTVKDGMKALAATPCQVCVAYGDEQGACEASIEDNWYKTLIG